LIHFYKSMESGEEEVLKVEEENTEEKKTDSIALSDVTDVKEDKKDTAEILEKPIDIPKDVVSTEIAHTEDNQKDVETTKKEANNDNENNVPDADVGGEEKQPAEEEDHNSLTKGDSVSDQVSKIVQDFFKNEASLSSDVMEEVKSESVKKGEGEFSLETSENLTVEHMKTQEKTDTQQEVSTQETPKEIQVVVKETPEVVKETSGEVEETPELVKETLEVVNKTPEVMKESPEVIMKNPEVVEESHAIKKETSTDVVEQTPAVVRETPDVVTEKHGEVKETTEVVKEAHEVVKEIPEVVEKSPEVVEETPEVVEETPEVVTKIPEVVKETTEAVKETPEAVKETPEVVKETLDIELETIDVVNDTPKKAKDAPEMGMKKPEKVMESREEETEKDEMAQKIKENHDSNEKGISALNESLIPVSEPPFSEVKIEPLTVKTEEKKTNRDSYEVTKEEIEDSLQFIKSKLSTPPLPPAKSKRSSKELKDSTKKENQVAAAPPVVPEVFSIPLPVVVKEEKDTVVKSNEAMEKSKNVPDDNSAVDCVPPIRPERSRKSCQKQFSVPDWTPPKQNVFQYILCCFKSAH